MVLCSCIRPWLATKLATECITYVEYHSHRVHDELGGGAEVVSVVALEGRQAVFGLRVLYQLRALPVRPSVEEIADLVRKGAGVSKGLRVPAREEVRPCVIASCREPPRPWVGQRVIDSGVHAGMSSPVGNIGIHFLLYVEVGYKFLQVDSPIARAEEVQVGIELYPPLFDDVAHVGRPVSFIDKDVRITPAVVNLRRWNAGVVDDAVELRVANVSGSLPYG